MVRRANSAVSLARVQYTYKYKKEEPAPRDLSIHSALEFHNLIGADLHGFHTGLGFGAGLVDAVADDDRRCGRRFLSRIVYFFGAVSCTT